MRSPGSQEEGLQLFWGAKEVSSLVDDPSAGNLKICHDQPDLGRSDKKCVDPQGSIFTYEEYV